MADLVCGKVGQTDAESVAQSQRFLQARLRSIWDSAAWRETLCLVAATVPAGAEWLLLPASVERVLKLRATGGWPLTPWEGVTVFDYSVDLFEGAGLLIGYALFAPVVHGPSRTGADAAVLLQTSGLTAAADLGRRASIELEQADGTRVTEVAVHDGTGFGFTSMGRFIVRLEKEATAGDYQAGLADGGGLGAALPATATEFPRRPRLRLVQRPSADWPVLALGKRRFPGWTNEFEAPALLNVENALIAYAMADMLERQRQYAKAQLKLQEAQGQMALLFDLERNQTACESRVVPG